MMNDSRQRIRGWLDKFERKIREQTKEATDNILTYRLRMASLDTEEKKQEAALAEFLSRSFSMPPDLIRKHVELCYPTDSKKVNRIMAHFKISRRLFPSWGVVVVHQSWIDPYTKETQTDQSVSIGGKYLAKDLWNARLYWEDLPGGYYPPIHKCEPANEDDILLVLEHLFSDRFALERAAIG